MCLKSIDIYFSTTTFIILSPFVCTKNPLSKMRSQIILALLATAISAAPVLTTGEAKVCCLFVTTCIN